MSPETQMLLGLAALALALVSLVGWLIAGGILVFRRRFRAAVSVTVVAWVIILGAAWYYNTHLAGIWAGPKY